MKPLHVLMALSFACLWGANFVAIKISLESFPPFLQQTLRFFLVSFPLIFFVSHPRGSWKVIFKISFFLWVLQVTFITLGLEYGVPPGMFSLLMQTTTIVVIILSTIFYHYRPKRNEIVGIILAITGVGMIAESVIGGRSSLAYLFVIPAVLSVSYASLVFKKNGSNSSNPFSLTVWCAFVTIFPMLALSLMLEGKSQIFHALSSCTESSVLALLYTVIFATLIATSFYIFLLKHYGPEKIIPFTLLIPIFGSLTSNFIYQETFTFIQSIGFVLILSGLVINQVRYPLKEAMALLRKLTAFSSRLILPLFRNKA
jgi:O-acetylserine/cysteine efflux transporter